MSHSLEFLKLLAHDMRWDLLQALAVSDYRVNELVEQLDQPMNLVSYHLKKLRDEALVVTRRSDADARDVYYHLDVDRLGSLYHTAGEALHPVLGEVQPQAVIRTGLRVLFLCTNNSARSQMAEAIMRRMAGEFIEVYSAGSQPTQIHPDTIKTLDELGIDVRSQQSQPLSLYESQPFDFVITVCDRAREGCPTFPGNGQQIHWSLPDPVMIENEAERRERFRWTAQELQSRIRIFLKAI